VQYPSAVIPGRAESANPESIATDFLNALWISGSLLARHPE
jgi:hypothetical protein